MSRFTREEERERKDLFLANLTEKMTRLAEKHCLKYIHEQDLAKLAEGAVCLENHYPGEDIFALLVYRSLSRIMTFIITELTYYTIARTPIQVVDQLCHHHHGGNFMPHIRNGIALTLGNKHFVVPFACAKFSLMPLGHTENSVAIWLNPAHIDEIFKVDQQTYVKTSFGWTIAVPMKERSIKERMDRSFTVHGIYVKKALEFDGPLEGSLHYLLPIRSSLVILDVLKDRMITDITHTWQEFHDHAMDSYLEDIRRQFGTDPLDKKNAG